MTFPAEHGPATLSELEGVFPAGWNRAVDVLCVVGPAPPSFFEALLEAGQARVVVYGSGAELAAPLPEPYELSRTPFDLFQVVLRFPGEPPTNAAIRRLAGALIGDRELAELADTLRGSVATWTIYRRSIDRLAPHWAEHGIANLARLAEHPSIACLADAFRGVPCVIVSPGPSLDRNAHLLPGLVGRAVVMTCSHALRALEEVGVCPDIVMVSDPKFTGRHFAGTDSTRSGSLFLDIVVDPRNFEFESRQIFTFATSESVDDWTLRPLGDDALIETGGSVACAEFSLAKFFGCDPVVLVGQDLALTDGRYYAESSIDGMAYVEPNEEEGTFELVRPHLLGEEEKLEVTRHPEEGMLAVPAWGGGEVRTSESLFTFLQWFRAFAQSSDLSLFNCTEGGAHIEGMEHLTLQEFIERHELPEVDVAERLDERAATVDLGERRRALGAHVEGVLEGLERCAEEARICADLARRAARDPRALDRLGKAEARLTEALGPLPLVSMLAQSEIREAQEEAMRATTLEGNLAAARRLFGVVIAAVRELRGPLERVRGSLAGGR